MTCYHETPDIVTLLESYAELVSHERHLRAAAAALVSALKDGLKERIPETYAGLEARLTDAAAKYQTARLNFAVCLDVSRKIDSIVAERVTPKNDGERALAAGIMPERVGAIAARHGVDLGLAIADRRLAELEKARTVFSRSSENVGKALDELRSGMSQLGEQAERAERSAEKLETVLLGGSVNKSE